MKKMVAGQECRGFVCSLHGLMSIGEAKPAVFQKNYPLWQKLRIQSLFAGVQKAGRFPIRKENPQELGVSEQSGGAPQTALNR
jgi:hypothetical protein